MTASKEGGAGVSGYQSWQNLIELVCLELLAMYKQTTSNSTSPSLANPHSRSYRLRRSLESAPAFDPQHQIYPPHIGVNRKDVGRR